MAPPFLEISLKTSFQIGIKASKGSSVTMSGSSPLYLSNPKETATRRSGIPGAICLERTDKSAKRLVNGWPRQPCDHKISRISNNFLATPKGSTCEDLYQKAFLSVGNSGTICAALIGSGVTGPLKPRRVSMMSNIPSVPTLAEPTTPFSEEDQSGHMRPSNAVSKVIFIIPLSKVSSCIFMYLTMQC